MKQSRHMLSYSLMGAMFCALLFAAVACGTPTNNANNQNNNQNNSNLTDSGNGTTDGGNGTTDGGVTEKPGSDTTGCTTNNDCAAGEECKNKACVKKPTDECKADADCTATKVCIQGKCMQRPCGCASDNDCPGGHRCDNCRCIRDNPIQPIDVGDECSETKQCKAGLTCIRGADETKSYCFTDCKTSGQCPSGTTCIVASDSISICAKEANEGEACSFGGKNQALCKIDPNAPMYCSPGTKKCVKYVVQKGEGADCGNADDPRKICDAQSSLACQNNKCIKLKDSDVLGPCGGQTGFQCKPGNNLQCLNTTPNSGHCFQTCTTSNPNCPAGQNCQPLQAGGSNGACIPTGNKDFGQACGVAPTETYDPAKLCKQGLSCVNFGRSICIEFSQGNCQTYQCKTQGTQCVDLSAGSSTFAGCFLTCTSDTDCKGGETFCRDLGQSTKVCWPKNPPGDVAYGEACQTRNATQATRCKEPNSCIETNQEGGYCGKTCSTDADCPAYTGGGKNLKGTCAPGTSSKICIFSCTKAGDKASCPNTLECVDAQGTLLCAPKPPVGPNDFMQQCDSSKPIVNSGCKAGLNCIGTQQSGVGFCSKSCSTTTDCGNAGSVSTTCIKGLLQDPNAGLCVAACGQPGQTCPNGLQCRNFGANSICAP